MSNETPPRVQLPVLDEMRSSLRSDGSRAVVHPADVSGRWATLRRWTGLFLILIWIALPLLRIGGRPAVFIDVLHRRFHLFGGTFNAQDVPFFFFFLTGLGFSLIVLTTTLGRAWCGWACPQTVFLEQFFRRWERLVDGPAAARIKRDKEGLSVGKLFRRAVLHLGYVVLAVVTAHIFVSYFVSMPGLLSMVGRAPSLHPEAFGWVAGLSFILYFDFAWFREQVCLGVCPYGRFQGVLVDNDSINVGYDARRGEPRGKAAKAEPGQSKGDCVDCGRCIAVCPTGIDIRNGPQLDCVACSACVDACDEIMVKVGKPVGLIRYDSSNGFNGLARRFLRPRLGLYAFLGTLGIVAASIVIPMRKPIEANLVRVGAAPFVISDDGTVRNAFQLRVVNKQPERLTFEVQAQTQGGVHVVLPVTRMTLDTFESRAVPVITEMPRNESFTTRRVEIIVRAVDGPPSVRATFGAPLLGPSS